MEKQEILSRAAPRMRPEVVSLKPPPAKKDPLSTSFSNKAYLSDDEEENSGFGSRSTSSNGKSTSASNPPAATSKEMEVANEYISNLQQQVCYLINTLA